MNDQQPVTKEARQQALDTAVAREAAVGARLATRTDYQAVVSYGGGVGNLVGVLITGGLWLLLYPAWRERRYILAVNEIGRVWRRSDRSNDWQRVDE